jgi:hypothetical protein
MRDRPHREHILTETCLDSCDRCRIKKAKVCIPFSSTLASCSHYTVRRGSNLQELPDDRKRLRILSQETRCEELVRLALRRSDDFLIRASYCQMREATDRALQRLYWACRKGIGFPGQIPDESKDVVTTMDILKGLSLIDPEFEAFELPNDVECAKSESKGAADTDRPIRAVEPHRQEALDSQTPSPSCSTSGLPLPTGRDPSPFRQDSSPESSQRYDKVNTKQQFATFSPQRRLVPRGGRMKNVGAPLCWAPNPVDAGARNIAEQHGADVDVEAFFDMSFCTPHSADSQSQLHSDHTGRLNVHRMMAPQIPPGHSLQPPTALISDGFLSPWPGSLAAAYQAVTT